MAANPLPQPVMGTGIQINAADRAANYDIQTYSESMYGCAFSELTATQRADVAAVMRADQRAATGGLIPEDSEAATATRLAERAARAAAREATRDRDDYAAATYGCRFAALTPAQMEDVSNYMRDDEKRTYGHVVAGGEAAEAKRQADLAYAATMAPTAAYDTVTRTGGASGYVTPPIAGTDYPATTYAGMAATAPPVGDYTNTAAAAAPPAPGVVPATGYTRPL